MDWDKIGQVAIPGAGVGIATAIAHGVIEQKYGGWRGWLRGFAAAILVGAGVNLGLDDAGIKETVRIAIVIACAYVAPDILDGLVIFARMVKADPVGMLQRVRSALRSGPAPAPKSDAPPPEPEPIPEEKGEKQ